MSQSVGDAACVCYAMAMLSCVMEASDGDVAVVGTSSTALLLRAQQVASDLGLWRLHAIGSVKRTTAQGASLSFDPITAAASLSGQVWDRAPVDAALPASAATTVGHPLPVHGTVKASYQLGALAAAATTSLSLPFCEQVMLSGQAVLSRAAALRAMGLYVLSHALLAVRQQCYEHGAAACSRCELCASLLPSVTDAAFSLSPGVMAVSSDPVVTAASRATAHVTRHRARVAHEGPVVPGQPAELLSRGDDSLRRGRAGDAWNDYSAVIAAVSLRAHGRAAHARDAHVRALVGRARATVANASVDVLAAACAALPDVFTALSLCSADEQYAARKLVREIMVWGVRVCPVSERLCARTCPPQEAMVVLADLLLRIHMPNMALDIISSITGVLAESAASDTRATAWLVLAKATLAQSSSVAAYTAALPWLQRCERDAVAVSDAALLREACYLQVSAFSLRVAW